MWHVIRNTKVNIQIGILHNHKKFTKLQGVTSCLNLYIFRDREEEISPSTLTIEFEPLSLPMMQLIKPLKKRFVYHFMGTRQTNRADKPEWYFTQILTWIKDHHEFVEKNVQPVYSKLNRKKVTAKVCNGNATFPTFFFNVKVKF